MKITNNYQKPRLFVDMDGVLAEWKPATHVEQLYEKGYFASLRPTPNVLKAVNSIAHYELAEVYILSAYLQDSVNSLPEKDGWLDIYCPHIPKHRRIFVPTGMEKVQAVPGGVRKTDVLLDDYTKNLLSWSTAAVGVKLLNGINHTNGTWKGECIHAEAPHYAIEAELLRIIAEAHINFSFVQLTTINNQENEYILKRGGLWNLKEADETMNSFQRRKIQTVYETYGQALLFNFNGPVTNDPAMFFERYNGQSIENYQADFVVPHPDAALMAMINEWRAEKSIRILRNASRLALSLGGAQLLWK